MSIKFEIPSNVDNFNTTDLTVTGSFTLDGYQINPSNASSGQVLTYNGSSFVPDYVSGVGGNIGASISGSTPKSILFIDSSGQLAQNNTNLFFDYSTLRLQIYELGAISGSDPLRLGTNIASAINIGYGTITTTVDSYFVATKSATFNSHIVVDGYTIDLSAGALSGQILKYNGTKFIAGTDDGGTITGSIAANQVAYGSGTNILQGNSNLTFNGSTLSVPAIDYTSALNIGTSNQTSLSVGRGTVATTIAGNTITLNTSAAPNLVLSQISTNLEVQSDGYRIFNTDGYGGTVFGGNVGNTNINGLSIIQTATNLTQIYTDGFLGFSTNGGQTVLGENGNSETFIRSGNSIVIQPLNTSVYSRFSVSGTTVRYKGEDASAPGTSISFLAGSGLIGHTGADGYVGGDTTLKSGNGGDGYTGQSAGAGGTVTIQAGNAGALNGGTGNGGGLVYILGGNASGASTGGGIIMDGGTGPTPGGVSIGATNAGGIILGNDSTYITVYASTMAFGASQDHSLNIGQSGIDAAGKKLYVRGGYGGVASATIGGAGGELNLSGGWGGDGTATKVSGAGGTLTLVGGNAGANNGGGGSDGGSVVIDSGFNTGAGIHGTVYVGNTLADAVNIGRSGKTTTVFGTLESAGPLLADHNVTLGSGPGNVLYFYATAVTSLRFGQGGAPAIFQDDAFDDTSSNQFFIAAGAGGDAYATGGGTGGRQGVYAGTGGAGTASLPAGKGGDIWVLAGDAGANAGGGGNDGGSIRIDAGAKTGAGIYGNITMGVSNASAINISRGGITTAIDGYLKIDGYNYLSHDIGNVDTLRLTEATNTTTGGNFRLRALKFFDNGAPTSALTHKIYAPDGNSIGIDCNRLQIIAPNMDSSQQDVAWNLGAYALTLTPASGSTVKLATNDLGSAGASLTDGYAILGGADSTTRNGLKYAIEANTSAGSAGVVLSAAKFTATDDQAIDGYLVGVNIDVSGGSSTNKQRITQRSKAHAAFSGSSSNETTAAIQTTNNTQTTLWAYTLLDTTLYWFEAYVIGRDTSGTDRAFYIRQVRAHREGGGATLGTVQTPATDETAAGWDATFTVSSNDIRLSITGATSTTINWTATIKYQAVSGNT